MDLNLFILMLSGVTQSIRQKKQNKTKTNLVFHTFNSAKNISIELELV